MALPGRFSLLMGILIGSLAAGADQPIQLFNDGRPIANYDEVVRDLKPGERIRFSNGVEFTIVHNYVPESGRLDKGSTAVLAISETRILRLPKRCSEPVQCEINQDYLRSFVRGWQALLRHNVPTPQLYLSESYLPEYVVVERLEVIELLRDWFNRLESGETLDRRRLEAFRKFMVQVSPFAHIGDFYDGQIALTPKGWVLFDWTDSHLLYRHGLDRDLSPLNGIYRQGLAPLMESLKSTLRAARETHHQCDPWLDQPASPTFSKDRLELKWNE